MLIDTDVDIIIYCRASGTATVFKLQQFAIAATKKLTIGRGERLCVVYNYSPQQNATSLEQR